MKHPENLLAYYGLAVAVCAVGLYIILAACLKKKPDLPSAINILIATVGAVGAVRLIGFVFTDQFRQVVSNANGTVWGLTAEDGIFVVVGGLALGWVSCTEVVGRFRSLVRT